MHVLFLHSCANSKKAASTHAAEWKTRGRMISEKINYKCWFCKSLNNNFSPKSTMDFFSRLIDLTVLLGTKTSTARRREDVNVLSQMCGRQGNLKLVFKLFDETKYSGNFLLGLYPFHSQRSERGDINRPNQLTVMCTTRG